MTDWKVMFARARECTYLDTAAEGLPPQRTRDALVEYFNDKAMGSPGRRRLHETEGAALEAVARLLGTEPVNLALIASASDGLNALANSIPWRPGDEVVVTDLEFPSGVLSWLRLRDRGVTLKVVASQGGIVDLDRVASAIGAATRAVCISHVSYKTGTRVPFLRELSEAAHAHGAMLVVDATQSLGRLAFDLGDIDFLVASTYKWMLGVHGLAVAYLSPAAREQLGEGTLGWYSVADLFRPDRFASYEKKPGAGWLMAGMPNFPAIYALRESVELLMGEGISSIEVALRPLVVQLRQGIARLGFDLLTPSGPEYASGIVSFAHPACKLIGAALERQGVIVWAGDGRVRASVHLYNDAADVVRFLDALQSAAEDLACTAMRDK
jgi:selenocysteine lyase/cysteine desulfurase